jgi:hypothetical protein
MRHFARVTHFMYVLAVGVPLCWFTFEAWMQVYKVGTPGALLLVCVLSIYTFCFGVLASKLVKLLLKL